MLSCSIWFSAPSFWMGGGLESRCVGRVYGADGAVRLSCSIWFSTPSFWMGGGIESRCLGRVYGADGAVRRTAPSAPYTRPTQRLSRHTTHPKTQCRKPYAATQHLMPLMMGVCTRNMSS